MKLRPLYVLLLVALATVRGEFGCFVPTYGDAWESGNILLRLPHQCTHVFLAFSGVSDKGAFLPSLDEHTNVRNIKDQIKQLQDRDTKVMLSLGGQKIDGDVPFDWSRWKLVNNHTVANFTGELMTHMVSFGLDGVDLDFEVDMRETGAPKLLTDLVTSIWNCMNDEGTKTKCVAPDEYDLICKRDADLCDDSRFNTSQISMSVWTDGACEDVGTETNCDDSHSFKKVFAKDAVKKNVQFVNVMSYDFELKDQLVIPNKKDEKIAYTYENITSASAKQWKKLLGDNGPDLVMGLSTERQAIGAAGSVVGDNGDFTNEALNALIDVINESADGLFVWSNKLNDNKNPALKNTPLGLLCKTASLACDSINYTCNNRPQKAKARPPPPRLAPDPLWSMCVHGAWNEKTSSASGVCATISPLGPTLIVRETSLIRVSLTTT
jgi:hypothetical protein